MIYIQRCGDRQLETVDEFDSWKEAQKMVEEYRMSDPSANYYLSSRCCKDWREEICIDYIDETKIN